MPIWYLKENLIYYREITCVLYREKYIDFNILLIIFLLMYNQKKGDSSPLYFEIYYCAINRAYFVHYATIYYII